MTQPVLSILIPTVVGREDLCQKLISCINEQKAKCAYWVEVLTATDNKEITIGAKREILYQQASGVYSWQIDDDDLISEDALERILPLLMKDKPDCLTFEEYVNMNGVEYSSNHSLRYEDWDGDGSRLLADGFHFQRTPFFKDIIKTEIARSVPIPHIRFGEDHQWAQALKPHLKSETHIARQIYRYIHNTTEFNERYGFTKD